MARRAPAVAVCGGGHRVQRSDAVLPARPRAYAGSFLKRRRQSSTGFSCWRPRETTVSDLDATVAEPCRPVYAALERPMVAGLCSRARWATLARKRTCLVPPGSVLAVGGSNAVKAPCTSERGGNILRAWAQPTGAS